jgi:hypothetical protein
MNGLRFATKLIYLLVSLNLIGCAQPQVFYALPKLIGIKGEKILVYTDGPPYWFSKSHGATFDGYVTSAFRMTTTYETVNRTDFVKVAIRRGLNVDSEMRKKIGGLETSYLYISDHELPKLFEIASSMGIAFVVKAHFIDYSETIEWERGTLTHRANINANFTIYDVKKRLMIFQDTLTADGIHWDFDASKKSYFSGRRKMINCNCGANVKAIDGLVRQLTRLIEERK